MDQYKIVAVPADAAGAAAALNAQFALGYSFVAFLNPLSSIQPTNAIFVLIEAP